MFNAPIQKISLHRRLPGPHFLPPRPDTKPNSQSRDGVDNWANNQKDTSAPTPHHERQPYHGRTEHRNAKAATDKWTVFVCNATEDEWNAFVDRDDHPIKVNYLQWFAETNAIHIVEFGVGHAHEAFVLVLHNAIHANPNVNRWLASRGGSMNLQGPAYSPDLSYGPTRSTPGAQLPADITEWGDFNTIKLDHKAQTVWATMPGVEYVLCIKSDNNLTDASYKLYDVAANGPPPQFTVQPDPEPIVLGTEVSFDACRVLGIPAGLLPPTGFPTPLVVNLYDALAQARTYV